MNKNLRSFFGNTYAKIKVSAVAAMMILVLLSSVFILMPVITVRAGSTTDFTHYVEVTINHDQVPSTQTDFPVLIHIVDDSALFSAMQNDSGYDLAFFDGTGGAATQYPHEIEYWNWDTGNSQVDADIWVNISSVSDSTNTVFYAYYGNTTIGNQEDMNGVWNSSYQAVWHLDDDDTDTLVEESTNWTRNGTKKANAEPSQGTGKAGYGQVFDDLDDMINISATSYTEFGIFDGSHDFTIEIWFNKLEFDATSVYFTPRDETNFYVRDNWVSPINTMGVRTEQPDPTWVKNAFTDELNTDIWYYWSVTYDADVGYIAYINGSQVNTSSVHDVIDVPVVQKWTYIGNDDTATYGTNGTLDEIRISNFVRSSDYFTTTWNNIMNQTTFAIFGNGTGAASSFSVAGLDSDDVTWTLDAGGAAWSNATNPGGTLQAITAVNSSDNCTDIYMSLTNLSYSGSNWLDTSNITVVVSIDNNDSYDATGYTLAAAGCNFSLNDNWAALSDDTNPFPIDAGGWTNQTFMVRFYLNINQDTAGVYVNSSAWKVQWKLAS